MSSYRYIVSQPLHPHPPFLTTAVPATAPAVGSGSDALCPAGAPGGAGDVPQGRRGGAGGAEAHHGGGCLGATVGSHGSPWDGWISRGQ